MQQTVGETARRRTGVQTGRFGGVESEGSECGFELQACSTDVLWAGSYNDYRLAGTHLSGWFKGGCATNGDLPGLYQFHSVVT